MTGERLAWFQLADRLKVPLQKLQAETTSTEFVDWMTYLEMEPNEFNADRHYLAQIAAVTAMCNVKDPRSIKVEDFLLRFEPTNEVKRRSDKATAAKNFFMTLGTMGKAISRRRRRGKKDGVQLKPRKPVGSPRA